MHRMSIGLPDNVYQLIKNEADEYSKSMSNTVTARIMANASGISKNMYRHLIATRLAEQTAYKELRSTIEHDSYNLSQIEYKLKYRHGHQADVDKLMKLSDQLKIVEQQLYALPLAVSKAVHAKKNNHRKRAI